MAPTARPSPEESVLTALSGDARSAGMPTGTLTLLFTDIEGSTHLWEADPARMKHTLARHDEILREAIRTAGGTIFKTVGDGFYAAFPNAQDALLAALSAQRALYASEATEDPLPRVRMAIHSGSVEERDADYFGPALNEVARLLEVAHGGQALVSHATYHLLPDELPCEITLSDLGEHRLRNLRRAARIYQLRHPDLPGDFPALRSLDALPHNLPMQLTSFIGREREIAEVERLLSENRLLTLTGAGGGGKTRLALQVGADVIDRYRDGVWIVELASLAEPSLVPQTAMNALGLRPRPGQEAREALLEHCAARRMLLILDNCEHLIDPAARFAAAALGSGTGVSILATSREMLGVPGEYPFQVKSLASPESLDEEVRVALLRYPAVRLFSERAELARPGWRVSAENAESVVQICQRLDGMPLAIELAAARLRMMPADKIAERLDDRFRLLTGGSRTVLPRQQTLEAAIDWSFELLSDEEKTLFSRLAVFMGGFTLEAAEAVCGVEPLDEYAVLDHLGHLVDKSLVQAEEKDDGVRYRMLETLRQYARLRLAESEEVGPMRLGHARYFLSLVEEAEPNLRGRQEAYWFGRLDDDLDNIRQALTWAIEAGETRIAQAMAGSLYRYFMYRFRYIEGREWAERAVAMSDDPSPGYVKALLAAGTMAQFSLDQDASMKHLDQAIDLAKSLDLERELSAALNNRANVASGMGMTEEALKLHEEHLELDRRRGDAEGIVIGLMNMASLNLDLGKAEEALHLTEEALEEATRLGSERLMFHSHLWSLGPLRTLGRFEQMESHLEAMRGHQEGPGVEFVPGVTEFWTSVLHLARDELPETIAMLKSAISKFRSMPDPYEVIAVVTWIMELGAEVLDRLRRPHLAARLLGSADAATREKAYVRGGNRLRRVGEIEHSLRGQLGDDAFDEEFHSGSALDTRDAHDALLEALEEHNQE